MKSLTSAAFMLVTVIFLIGCSGDTPTEFEGVNRNGLASSEDATFLLVDAKDPVGAETEPAFLLDGPGPFFFWALDLTDEQKEQLREIGGQYRETFRQLEAQWRQGNTSWETIQSQRDSLHQLMHDEMVGILNEQQLAVLEEIEAQLESGQYPAIVIEKKVAFLTEKLSLTEDQQGEISELLADYGAQLLAVRDSSQNPRDFHEAMRSIMAELDEEVTALLDEQQLEAYDVLKEEHRPEHRPEGPPGHGGPGHHGGPGGPGGHEPPGGPGNPDRP